MAFHEKLSKWFEGLKKNMKKSKDRAIVFP